jgi:hypothetical protein
MLTAEVPVKVIDDVVLYSVPPAPLIVKAPVVPKAIERVPAVVEVKDPTVKVKLFKFIVPWAKVRDLVAPVVSGPVNNNVPDPVLTTGKSSVTALFVIVCVIVSEGNVVISVPPVKVTPEAGFVQLP